MGILRVIDAPPELEGLPPETEEVLETVVFEEGLEIDGLVLGWLTREELVEAAGEIKVEELVLVGTLLTLG